MIQKRERRTRMQAHRVCQNEREKGPTFPIGIVDRNDSSVEHGGAEVLEGVILHPGPLRVEVLQQTLHEIDARRVLW